MSTVGAIAGIINTGLSILDRHIDDPVRRLRARQDYINALRKQVEEILDEEDVEKLDKLLLDFISTVHSL